MLNLIFNLTAADSEDVAKYGFTNCGRSNVDLETTDEVAQYDIYSFYPKKGLFQQVTETLSLSPFRMIMALPKPVAAAAAARQIGGSPMRVEASNPAALGIKINGTTLEEIETSVDEIGLEYGNDSENSPVYNLQGVRVPSTSRGILIRKGNKEVR